MSKLRIGDKTDLIYSSTVGEYEQQRLAGLMVIREHNQNSVIFGHVGQ